jgi:ketosteroid isomerase-like protein
VPRGSAYHSRATRVYSGISFALFERITFQFPGRSPIAGTYTRGQFSSFIGRVMELSGGTFRESVVDVVANDHCGLVLAKHEFERKGRRWVYGTAHIYRIEDGKLAEFREYPEDLYAYDEAWS